MDSPNEAVYFKITNVEYDVLSNATVDEFYGSSLGEWGCWVDHSQTRIVQTGVEQSRVPYAQDSAELGTRSADCLRLFLLNSSLTKDTRQLSPMRNLGH